MRTRTIAASVFGLALCGLAAPASAEIKWTLNSGAAGCSTSGSNFGNSRECPADSGPVNDVTATAWSFTGNDSGTNNALESAFLGVYSGGLGVTNRDGTTAGPSCSSGLDCDEGTPSSTDSPEHAVDNNQRFDAVLFSFDNAVRLSRVATGYVSGDSDLTVLAYTGGGTPALGGQTVTELLGAVMGGQGGWTAIGDYAGGSSTGSRDINAGGVSSKYWLISAYNPNFGAADIGSSFSSYDDHFKIKLVAARDSKVPEPGTMLLFGAAALGLWWRQRLQG
jgi:hypothetical protein